MQRLVYRSMETGVDRRIHVYTPPNYDRHKKYPVLYVLHGIGGTENEWLENSDPQSILNAVIAKDESKAMIAVFANGRAMVPDSVPKDIFSPEAVNAFLRFEKDLLESLIPFVEKQFQAYDDRMKRGICGLSMGGGQSLNIGLANTELFAWVGAFSPAPNTDVKRFKLDQTERNPFIWITCGKSDDLLPVSKATSQFLEAKKIKHDFTIIPGGHDWPVWTYGLENFTSLIFRE